MPVGETAVALDCNSDGKALYSYTRNCTCKCLQVQEGLAVASIARVDPSTLPGDDPFPRARMHRDRNAR